MEPKFQNTFIPKRPVVTQQKNVPSSSRRKTSIFGMLVMLFFIISLVAAGGVFAYTKYLERDISNSDKQLQEEIASLQPELIDELAVADAQLTLAENMLSDHLVPSRLFDHLEEITLQNVRFTDFSYSALPGRNPSVTLSGIAPNYEAVALQSDVFARDEFIVGSLFSDLNETEAGNVSFEVSADVSSNLTSIGK